MKTTKVFIIYLLCFILCLIALEYARDHFYAGQVNAPLIRIRTLVIIIGSIVIMKLTFTAKGFKLFILVYTSLWLIYFSLLLSSKFIHANQLIRLLDWYKDITFLSTPLPLIFFWIVDRMYNTVKKQESPET